MSLMRFMVGSEAGLSYPATHSKQPIPWSNAYAS
jgi:hypothetical protein